MDLPSPVLADIPLSPQFNFKQLPPRVRSSTRSSKSSFLSRQWLHLTTFLALFSLILISSYVLLGPAAPTFRPVAHPSPLLKHSPFHIAMTNLADSNNLWKADTVRRPQISLTPEQELAALSGFIISLPAQNVIPQTVDPSKPIDPQLVLDFDTRADGAVAEMKQLEHDVWESNPVVLYYSKSSAAARELISIIDSYYLDPAPVMINLHDRHDAEVLEPLLERITSSSLPILLIHGQPVDVSTVDRVRYLSISGALQTLVSEAGAIIDGAKRKKGRK